MDLPSSLVKKFVEVTKEPESTSTGHYVYGTAIVNGDEKYVQVDGSEGVTSVSIATDIATGDRVLLYIEDHKASVIGNVTCPASGRGAIDVSEMLQDFETLVVGDLYAITETVETIYANYVSTGFLETYYLTAEYIVGNYLLIENASLTYATIDSLDAEKARITALESSQITTEYLEANYANITDLNALEAQIKNLDAEYAKIDWVEANYATIQELYAYEAYIVELNSDIANIKSLLAGVAGVGELDAIHLTADNVVIEDALITNAMIANVSADKLTAGTIYTSLIRIQTAEEDESLYIDNSLIQMSEDDLVRLQAGKDATGEYNFYIWNSEGNIMFDATGATAYGIGKEVIVNTHVADDANIAGYKLDIASVASYLSEDGSLIIDGEQVVIGGGTLNYILDQINEQIYELQGVSFDGITNITLYFALGTSDTEPPIDNEDTVPALTDVAITDYSFTDVYEEGEGPWSTDEPSQEYGLYKWARYLCDYSDGHTEWSTPFLLTDSYLRQETSTLMTELEVVQGEISAKIWQTDIDEALTTTISDLWTEIDAQLGSILLEVGNVTTDVDNLFEQLVDINLTLEGISADVYNLETNITESFDIVNEQISDITINLNEISADVYSLESTTTESFNLISEQLADFTLSIEDINLGLYNLETNTALSISNLENQIAEMDNLKDFKVYYCLWNSSTEQPIDASEVVPALTDVAITDYSFTDVYDSDDFWTEEPLQPDYGQYLWVKYWLEFQDGHTEWRGPYCLTDEYIREQWADINIELNSISLEVGEIQNDLENNYATKASLVLSLDESTGLATLSANANQIYLNSDQITIQSDNFSLIDGNLYAVGAYLEGDIIASSLYATNAYLEGEVLAETYPFKTVIQGGQIEFYYQNERACYMYASETNYLRIMDIRRLRIGSPTEDEWRGILVENGTSSIELMAAADNEGTVGLYDQTNSTWIVARETSEKTTFLGSSSLITRIRGSEIIAANDMRVGGTVDCAGLASTATISLTRYSRTISLNIASSTDRGLYDNTYSRWLIAAGDDNQIYVGSTSVQTNIRGAEIRASTGTGYFVQSNNYGTIQIGTNSNDRMGMYDADTKHWIVRRDENARINLGNTDWDTILYGKSVYLNGTTTAVTSDRQFKDNIEPFEPEATDNLTDKLTPKIYTVASDPETKHIGFIVDEVEDAMRAAGYDPDEYGLTDSYLDEDGNEMGAIRYDEFIPILLYEIQELRDRVNALENPEEGLIDPGIQLN